MPVEKAPCNKSTSMIMQRTCLQSGLPMWILRMVTCVGIDKSATILHGEYEVQRTCLCESESLGCDARGAFKHPVVVLLLMPHMSCTWSRVALSLPESSRILLYRCLEAVCSLQQLSAEF